MGLGVRRDTRLATDRKAQALEVTPGTQAGLRPGTMPFLRASVALFLAGVVTFGVLYCTQPLLPALSAGYHVSPEVASLSLSLSAVALAIGLLVAGAISDRVGRKPVMAVAVGASALLALASAFAPNFAVLLVLRTLIGFTLSGLPAVAMTYLGEEVQHGALGLAMGLYISGNSVGGMGGRLLVGVLADSLGDRAALAGIGILACACSVAFVALLPASRRWEARHGHRRLLGALAEQFRDGGQRVLIAEGALLMGGFVALYNYLGFRLLAAPYRFNQSTVGLIFLVYLAGTISSPLMGRLADVRGRARVLPVAIAIMGAGVATTLAQPPAVIVAGVAVATFGFFGAHSIASSWVSRRAVRARAQATSAYLFCYYAGSSITGTLGGFAWHHFEWPGVVILIDALLACALALAVWLAFLPPAALPESRQADG